MKYKTTKSLFRKKYQYKLVLICAGANWFRGGDWDSALDNLKKITLDSNIANLRRHSIKNQEDLTYAFKLQHLLKSIKDIEVRVESPWISVYCNSKPDIDALINLDKEKVKYVCVPPDTPLTENTIVLPKVDFEYRITLGKTIQMHDAFLAWADSNAKVKVTKSCRRDLSRERSWGGTYFYLTGDKNLLLAKMHLGGSINKVERIIKA